jgi:F420-dependent oxidoreductase-like protein
MGVKDSLRRQAASARLQVRTLNAFDLAMRGRSVTRSPSVAGECKTAGEWKDGPMRLVVFTEPQLGASYADQLRVAQHAEELGFDGFFRSDHYINFFAGDGLPGPTDSWVTLGALAVQTNRIRLGTLVTSATFRLPGPLAISVAQVDVMSGGRVELGLGAGWNVPEHEAYGIPFLSTKERFDRLAEQLAIVTGLWRTPAGEQFTFRGGYYDLLDSPALPKPAQSPGPPIIIGGHGKRRTPRLAAQYADEFNVPFGSLDATRAAYQRVAQACVQEQRDAAGRAPLVLSAAQTIAVGKTETQARRRAETIGGQPPLFGTPDQVVEQIGRFAEIGASRLFLQILDLTDLDHLDLIAAEVAPQLTG